MATFITFTCMGVYIFSIVAAYAKGRMDEIESRQNRSLEDKFKDAFRRDAPH